jgi:hypothetical protein
VVIDDGPTRHGGPVLTLHQLIRDRMAERGWSYTDLERRSDHALTRGRWQQLGSGLRQKKFPDPASLTVIARVLEVDITTVVLATAQALGLDARREGSDLAHLLPAETDRLSERMRDAILTLIRAAVADTTAGNGVDGPAGPDGLPGLTLEWPKKSAPSRRRDNGSVEGGVP